METADASFAIAVVGTPTGCISTVGAVKPTLARPRVEWRVATAIILAVTSSMPAGAATAEMWSQLRCRGKHGLNHYPPTAVQRHESGAVLLEYSVNAAGRIERIVVLESAAPESLDKAAMKLMRTVRCKPDAGWINDGGPQRRLKVNVLFQILNEETVKPIDADAGIISISTEAPKPKKLW